MKNDLTSKKYLDAKSAGCLVGYSPDYVTRLAREEKIIAIQSGRQWLVDIDSLKLFSLTAEAEKRERANRIRFERKRELAESTVMKEVAAIETSDQFSQSLALIQTGAVAVCLFLLMQITWFAFEQDVNPAAVANGFNSLVQDLSSVTYEPIASLASSQTASLSFVLNPDKNQKAIDESHDDGVVTAPADVFDGVIVVEESLAAKELLHDMRESFSDEVQVEFDGADTGVITPEFKNNKDGQSYRFLLTPVRAHLQGSE